MDRHQDPDTALAELFTELRPLVFSIAYRMLGSVAEAEDVVQETMLRAHRELRAGIEIESPKAYLTAIATRLAIDQLRSARVRRETYVGPWLPEPLLTDTAPGADVAATTELADSLSMAFLMVLERLSPVERAVFLLREAFDYGYDEIAPIVGKSEDNCRQIAVRARRHVDAERPRFEPSAAARDALAARFLAAAQEGELAALEELLAAEVVFTGDGGGQAHAFPAPLVGREHVAHAVRAIFRQGARLGAHAETAHVNGQPGLVARDAAGAVVSVLTLEIAGGAVVAIRSVVNPDKLGHLGPVSDVARRRPGRRL
jgi:RNA polymerase sigma-70 factor (ECF subfamily)